MQLEKAIDRRFLGYRSILGWYHWLKVEKKIVFGKNVSMSDRIWCLRHGFKPSDLNLFGRENLRKNYKDYLSTKQYYKLHPINGPYSFWIDDKLTMKYVLSPFNQYLPAYYYQLEKKGLMRLCDCPAEFKDDIDGVIDLLDAKKVLVAKRLFGSGGDGFYKLESLPTGYRIAGKDIDREGMKDFLAGLRSYLIMECIVNHQTIREIWPNATNTMRMLYGNCDGEWVLMRSFIRFGNEKSNGVDNAHNGGIESIIDENTGHIMFTQIQDAAGHPTIIDVHPDSGASFDIEIPRWQEITEMLETICRHYPQLRYMGYDVAVTDNGFKILEVNSLSGLMAAQTKEPLLKDPKTRRVFQSFGLKGE